jgi:hypothetical protein
LHQTPPEFRIQIHGPRNHTTLEQLRHPAPAPPVAEQHEIQHTDDARQPHLCAGLIHRQNPSSVIEVAGSGTSAAAVLGQAQQQLHQKYLRHPHQLPLEATEARATRGVRFVTPTRSSSPTEVIEY